MYVVNVIFAVDTRTQAPEEFEPTETHEELRAINNGELLCVVEGRTEPA